MRNSSPSTAPQDRPTTWATALAATSGTLAAIALAPTASQAVVVNVTNRPVTLSINDGGGAVSYWDVDGDSSNDFRLFNYYGFMFFASDGSNGRGLVAPFGTDNVQALASGFQVGPTVNPFAWGPGDYRFRNAMYNNGAIGYDWNYGFNQGDNFFGFRFLENSSLHYGWAVINFDSPNKSVTISSWAYNTLPDSPVTVGAVTQDVPGPLGLGGLAAGAAWTRKLRRRIRQSA